MESFDLAIIGSGPGGYVAAIRAAKLGLSVALIEYRDLGGTCLNRGCIPSKTMLKHAQVLEQIKDANRFGIEVKDFSFSLQEMVKRKNNVVNQLRNGIKGLLKQNKIQLYQGVGYVDEKKMITISSKQETKELHAKNIILANGSKPFIPNIPGISDMKYYTSDTIFDMIDIPKRLVIVGGGVIGLEIACIFNSFHTKVDIIEMAEQILPNEDCDAAGYLMKHLQKNGIAIHTHSKVISMNKVGEEAIIEIEKNDGKINLSADSVFISVGRVPNLTGLDVLPIEYDGQFVKVDENMRTSIHGIYAVGDLIGGYQLAHAASHEGIKAVNHIAGIQSNNKSIIPRCVYTFPQVASVGFTEKEAEKLGYATKVKKVDFAINGKAVANGENTGFMKIIADETYGEILGVVMVGSHVTEMISQATSFIQLEGTVEELEKMVFPHPTISEVFFEAASSWLGKGIHIY